MCWSSGMASSLACLALCPSQSLNLVCKRLTPLVSKGQARLKIRPAPMHHLFEMADERQHREYRLHEHPVLPLPALTQFEIRGIARRGMEAGITQYNHPPINLLNQPLKGVVSDMRGGTRPPHDQPPLIEQETEFAPDNPAMIREAFATNLLRAAP